MLRGGYQAPFSLHAAASALSISAARRRVSDAARRQTDVNQAHTHTHTRATAEPPPTGPVDKSNHRSLFRKARYILHSFSTDPLDHFDAVSISKFKTSIQYRFTVTSLNSHIQIIWG